MLHLPVQQTAETFRDNALAERDERAGIVAGEDTFDDSADLDPGEIDDATEHRQEGRVGGVSPGRDPDE